MFFVTKTKTRLLVKILLLLDCILGLDFAGQSCLAGEHGEIGQVMPMMQCDTTENAIYSNGLKPLADSSFVCCAVKKPIENAGHTTVTSMPNVTEHPNLSMLPGFCGEYLQYHIFNGRRAHIGELPWMVYLYSVAQGCDMNGVKISWKIYTCGGSLVTSQHVLTAAHCLVYNNIAGAALGEFDSRRDPDWEFRDEDNYTAPDAVHLSLLEVFIHPYYDACARTNDIAVIKLSRSVDFHETIKPVCLPHTAELQSQINPGSRLLTAGWGSTNNTDKSNFSFILRKVTLRVIPKDECQKLYLKHNIGITITQSHLCTLGSEKQDTCYGDSGSPLMAMGFNAGIGIKPRYVQHGIVTCGYRTCGEAPSLNTHVAYYMK